MIKFDYSNNDLEWDDMDLDFYQDGIDKVIDSSLINSIMENEQFLEKKRLRWDYKKRNLI